MVMKFQFSKHVHQLMQLLLIYVWVSSFVNTDAYINVYIFIALAGAAAVFIPSVRCSGINRFTKGILGLCAIAFSFAVSVANYPLYQNLGIFDWIFAVLASAGCIIAFWNILLLIYTSCDCESTLFSGESTPVGSAKVFLSVFFLSVSINLIYLFSSQYPAIGCNDAVTQITQIKNGVYTNHHPYWHTMVIKMCLNLGALVSSDINVGVAVYSFWQILLVAFCFAYAAVTLYQAGYSRNIVLLVSAVFLLAPYHISYSVTMWKDTPFGVVVLLYIVALYRVLHGVGKNHWLNYITLFLGALGFGLWRSNGWLALVASFAVFIPFFFKNHKKMLLVIALAIVASWALKGPYLAAIHVRQPDLVESLSIPVQQVARTICDGGDITEEEYARLDKVVDVDRVPELYLDYLSDPIKDEIRRKDNPYFEENGDQYLKLWIQIGLRNPRSYIHAWIDQTKGFWNAGYDFWVTGKGVPENVLGLRDYQLTNPIQYLFYRYIFSIQEVPCLNPIFSIGLHTWLLVMVFVCTALKKRKASLLCLPVVMLIGTLVVASPVAYEFRYAYGMFTSLPFLLPATLISKE